MSILGTFFDTSPNPEKGIYMYPYIPLLFLTFKLAFAYGMTKAIIMALLRIVRAIQQPHSWDEDAEERPLIRRFGEMEGKLYELTNEYEFRHDQLIEKLNKLIIQLPETTTVAEDYAQEVSHKRRRKKELGLEK
jgi:hypothetical protein